MARIILLNINQEIKVYLGKFNEAISDYEQSYNEAETKQHIIQSLGALATTAKRSGDQNKFQDYTKQIYNISPDNEWISNNLTNADIIPELDFSENKTKHFNYLMDASKSSKTYVLCLKALSIASEKSEFIQSLSCLHDATKKYNSDEAAEYLSQMKQHSWFGYLKYMYLPYLYWCVALTLLVLVVFYLIKKSMVKKSMKNRKLRRGKSHNTP